MPESIVHIHQVKTSNNSLSVVLILFVPLFVFALVLAYLYIKSHSTSHLIKTDITTVPYNETHFDEFEETIEFNGEEIPAPRL